MVACYFGPSYWKSFQSAYLCSKAKNIFLNILCHQPLIPCLCELLCEHTGLLQSFRTNSRWVQTPAKPTQGFISLFPDNLVRDFPCFSWQLFCCFCGELINPPQFLWWWKGKPSSEMEDKVKWMHYCRQTVCCLKLHRPVFLTNSQF